MGNKKLSARERISSLLDDLSFVEIGGYVTSRNTDFNLSAAQTPADGVITGYGVINNKLVYVYSQDANVLGGAIGEMHARKITKVYELALKMGAPVIGLVDCAGLRLQEATDALSSFGDIFLKQSLASGVVPQITGLFGISGGGTSIISTLSDFTFMSKESTQLFINSPNALEGNYASKLDTSSADYHAENTGLVDVVCKNELELLGEIRQLINILPSNNEEDMSYDDCTDDLNRVVSGIEAYSDDSAHILSTISDNEFFMEFKKAYAKDLITGFIRLNGYTIGCIANQYSVSKGDITTNGADKAAGFVRFCDSFNIPILTLTNAKGLKATVAEEKTIGKAIGKMTYAFASATVPKVNLVIGESFGTAYIAMNSKSIGADIEYAWGSAKIGMMDPTQAVKIIYADEISDADDSKGLIREKAAEYGELQSSAASAAKRGLVDDIIEPDATRKRLVAAFEMLFTKRVDNPAKKHGTV